jgi:hypothetical protein
MHHTIILYQDGHREIQYGMNAPMAPGIAQINYCFIDSKEIEEIKHTTSENVQKLLEFYI